MSAMISRQETVGACAIALLAAVNEGLGTCLHSCHGADKVQDVRRVLKLPEAWNTIWVQLVGHPLEEREAEDSGHGCRSASFSSRWTRAVPSSATRASPGS